MCITRNELEKKIEELRSLKALKEETENELKALEHEVMRNIKDEERSYEFCGSCKRWDSTADWKRSSKQTRDLFFWSTY